MKPFVILAVGAVCLLLLGAALWMIARPTRVEPRPAPSARSPAPVAVPNPAPDAELLGRAAVEPAGPESAADLPGGPLLVGRVVDTAGAALSGLAVGLRGDVGEPRTTVRSAERGSFALPAGELPAEVEVVEAGWTTLQRGIFDTERPLDEVQVVAARAAPILGTVVDRAGHGLPGAKVVASLEDNDGVHWAVWTSAEGAFAIDAAPSEGRLALRTRLTGWRTDARVVAAPCAEELRIVLEPEEASGPVLEGTVEFADGRPAAGALVALGSARTSSRANGTFRLACGWFGPQTPLVAVLRGYQPAILAGYGARLDPAAASLPHERLVLPGPELAIQGSVVDAGGQPCKGWLVALEDGTALDPGGILRDVAEGGSGARPEVRTDGSGTFRIGGLANRDYVLLAHGRDRASRGELALRSAPIPAGRSGVVLCLSDAGTAEAVSGRVVDEAGAPVAGVEVGLGRLVPPGSRGEFARVGGFRATSDASGAFAIADAPPGLVFVVAIRPEFLPDRLAVAPGAPRHALVLHLRRLRALRFDGSAASPAPDRLIAFSDRGPCELWVLDGWLRGDAVRLADSRSSRLGIGPEARAIAVYRGPLELARLALDTATHDEANLVWP